MCQCLHSLHDNEMAVRTSATAALKALVVVVGRYQKASEEAHQAAEVGSIILPNSPCVVARYCT